MTSDKDSTRTSQARMELFDQMMVALGGIMLFRAYEIFPEEPAVMMGVLAFVPLLLGGIRLLARRDIDITAVAE